MRSTKRNVAALCCMRSILLVAILIPWLTMPLPSAAAPGTNSFTGSASVRDQVTFTTTGSMYVARQCHYTATLLNDGRVLVAGGVLGNTFFASAELYDPTTGLWNAIGSMNDPRAGHTATLLNNGKVLVAGGDSAVMSSRLNTAELYNPTTGIWSLTGRMTVQRRDHTATLLNDGRVLVVGGNSVPEASAELYDQVTGTWSTTSSMSVARWLHTATLLPNGKVLITGGWGGGTYLVSAELYDPVTGTWSNTGSMDVAREGPTATLLNNGKVLVTGGRGPDGIDLVSAELYDPSTGIWSNTGSMNVAREGYTATLLNNGKVLVTGGFAGDGSAELASAELYDPATGIWSFTGSMSDFRYLHTATLLNDGRVLVAGYTWVSDHARTELATLFPSNTFTGTLTLPSGWFSSATFSTQFVGTTSSAAISAGALSNDNATWCDWITATSDVTTTTTWPVNGEGANTPVYLRLRDVNGQVATVVTGTVNIDLTKPASIMTTLPAASPVDISLSWSGSDALSGVSTYDVQVRPGIGGAWTDILSHTTSTSTNYTGTNGIIYYFSARASDMAGNVEDWPFDYDTFTLVLWKVFLPLIIK